MKPSAFVISAAVLALAVLAGCVSSVHSLFSEDDVIHDQALLGAWVRGDGSSETWLFTEGEEDEYRLVHTDAEGRSAAFVAHLLELDGTRFLDLFPEAPQPGGNGYYRSHFYPVHSFAVVEQVEPTLELSFMNYRWLHGHLAQNPDAIAHVVTKNLNRFRLDGGDAPAEQVVLTARTPALQRFVLRHLGTDDAFTETTTLERLREAA